MGHGLKVVSAWCVVGLFVGASGCNPTPDADVGNAPERHLIDDVAGTYRDIGLDDRPAEVVRALGKPLAAGRGANEVPASRDVYDISAATHRGFCPGPYGEPLVALRYQVVGFQLARGRVCDVLIIDDGAATDRGVAIGDDLDEVERAYPGAFCGEESSSLTEPSTVYPFCAAPIAARRHIWFGGDPINTIELRNVRFKHTYPKNAGLAKPDG